VAEGMTAMELAEDLGFLQPDDVRHVVVDYLGLDLHDEVIPAAVCVEVRDVLNPNHERTAAAPYYWPGHPRSFESASPTAGEGDYDFDW
jgi:hypothetical protein